MDGPEDGSVVAYDAVQEVRSLPKDKVNGGTLLFSAAGDDFDAAKAVLETGDVGNHEYLTALRKVTEALVDTAGLALPPVQALKVGIFNPSTESTSARYFKQRLAWMSFKHATGWDLHWYWKRKPTPQQLLQQVALASAAVACREALPEQPREVVVDLLEEVFVYLSDKRTLRLYKDTLEGWDCDVRRLQFGLMRMLTVIYREMLVGDRVKYCKYLFRHAEAAGIMAVLMPQHYAGHAEHAWNMLQKITLGIMHVSEEVWLQSVKAAKTAASMTAACQHDFALLPTAYTLVWFVTVGIPGSSFDLSEVKRLLTDIDKCGRRLEAWGMKDRVLFDCYPKRWLVALKAEWEKVTAPRKGKKAAAAAAAALEGLPKGHVPVTDWRVFDQRFFGYYVWLEPPMQASGSQKCTNCKNECLRVHRCDTCKLLPYCSSMCAQAHMFDHECVAAPKPWLSAPMAPKQPTPDELGEEGFMGFIPWSLLRYALCVLLLYGVLYLWRKFDAFRADRGLGPSEGVVQALQLLYDEVAMFLGRGSTNGGGGLDSLDSGATAPNLAEDAMCQQDGTCDLAGHEPAAQVRAGASRVYMGV